MYLKGEVQQIRDWLKNQSTLSEAQKKDSSPVKAPEVSTRSKQGKEIPKEKSEGKAKGKAQVEKALPSELQNSKEGKDSHGQFSQYSKSFDGIQKQGGGKN
ncbi:hypothetical protein O181_040343 [Austropuccinia psidii MF-1]|uniref:Uncharacterized protein n=1 Tax=Austropuccinia psidii MF-1 TaxID=1389203 RepID=A0A9Q3DF62_9BASI|nr:hypothetical protein [Austropuccinia psidii MF-1]